MSHYIAIDIGGTQMRAALYPLTGLEAEVIAKIPTHDELETPLQRLIDLITRIMPAQGKVLAIGLAVPGPVDPYQGIVIEAPNVAGWDNLPLQSILEDHFKIPVAIGNDANLAALGEWRYGAGQGHKHMLYLTVSTGIGSGVIYDGKLLLGVRGLAGELGHVSVVEDGPLCGCGQTGHLEALAAGPAMLRWLGKQFALGRPSSLANIEELTGRHVSQAAEMGDALAIEALARSGRYMGIALASFLHIFNPSCVVIGGGVSQSGEFLLAPLRKALQEHVLNPAYLADLDLRTAIFGDEVGLAGALALVRDQYPA